jgi:adenylate kinase family enzyme
MDFNQEKFFFIFVGRSGSGKGTQVALLKDYLATKGYTNVVHTTTGAGFRDFIAEDNYIARKAKEVNEQGGLQPEFLAVWVWANIFIKTLKGGETVMLDGAPRKAYEVNALHSLITFLEYTNPVVIYLDVPEHVAKEQLISRAREDDNEESINRKMNWFNVDVLPALNLYLHDPRYKVLHINGHQSIEDVHKEIVEKLSEVA